MKTNNEPRTIIVLPVGLIAKIQDAANFKTKREVADQFAKCGLTYNMLRDMQAGYVEFAEEAGVERCVYRLKTCE